MIEIQQGIRISEALSGSKFIHFYSNIFFLYSGLKYHSSTKCKRLSKPHRCVEALNARELYGGSNLQAFYHVVFNICYVNQDISVGTSNYGMDRMS
jgi:hypothetical protein